MIFKENFLPGNNFRLLRTALNEYGVKEMSGIKNNRRIVKYHSVTSGLSNEDSIPWCASFVAWVCQDNSLPHSSSRMARHWLDIGEKIKYKDSLPGDVVILSRGKRSSWKGHVGFLFYKDDFSVHLLGGNQSDTVNITSYDKSRILGIRRILDYTHPTNNDLIEAKHRLEKSTCLLRIKDYNIDRGSTLDLWGRLKVMFKVRLKNWFNGEEL